MKTTPEHRKLYESLRRQIADGRYRPGELLPSEHELSSEYGISRPTVRKALDRLVAEGLIVKHHGKGSIVKGAPKGIGILSLLGTTSAVGDESLTTEIVVKPEIRAWNEAFSFPISEVEREQGCIYFERVRRLDGVPLFFDTSMLPAASFPGFESLKMENTSLFELLRERYNVLVTGGTQQLYAIRADKRLQDYFDVRPGHPVLQLNRRIETSREGLYIYSQVFCITHGYGLTGTF